MGPRRYPVSLGHLKGKQRKGKNLQRKEGGGVYWRTKRGTSSMKEEAQHWPDHLGKAQSSVSQEGRREQGGKQRQWGEEPSFPISPGFVLALGRPFNPSVFPTGKKCPVIPDIPPLTHPPTPTHTCSLVPMW